MVVSLNPVFLIKDLGYYLYFSFLIEAFTMAKEKLIICVSHPNRVHCLLMSLYALAYNDIDTTYLKTGAILSFVVSQSDAQHYKISEVEIIWNPREDPATRKVPNSGKLQDFRDPTIGLSLGVELFKGQSRAGNLLTRRQELYQGRYVIIVQSPQKETGNVREYDTLSNQEENTFTKTGDALGNYIEDNKTTVQIGTPCFSSDSLLSLRALSHVLDILESRIKKKNPRPASIQSTRCIDALRNAYLVVLPCNHEVEADGCKQVISNASTGELYPRKFVPSISFDMDNVGTHRIDYRFYKQYYIGTDGTRNKSTSFFNRPKTCDDSNNMPGLIHSYVKFARDRGIPDLVGSDATDEEILRGDGSPASDFSQDLAQTSQGGGGVTVAARRGRKRKTARKRRRSNKYHNNRKTGRTRTRRGRR